MLYNLSEDSYIGLTSRQLKKRIKKKIPRCVVNFLGSTEKEAKSFQIMNALKRSSIAEHLVNDNTCAEHFYLDWFKITKTCGNTFDLIKLEAICILIRKPKLFRQKEFDNIVSLFN